MKQMPAAMPSPAGEQKKVETIVLPEDPALRERLARKIEEYKTRLAEETKENRYRAPETLSGEISGLTYKVAVLSKLLEAGTVDISTLATELTQKHGKFTEWEYNNACAVINDYCTTGGKRVSGGTGI